MKDVLDTYGRCTGQQINPSKCSIMFNDKCQAELQDQVKLILRVEKNVFEAQYLGLPTPLGFQYLKEQLSKRLKDYTEKNMSIAAKEVLIKVVAQALPTYIMSVSKLPLGLCDDLSPVSFANSGGGLKMARERWHGSPGRKCY
jgi:hypothetical protein